MKKKFIKSCSLLLVSLMIVLSVGPGTNILANTKDDTDIKENVKLTKSNKADRKTTKSIDTKNDKSNKKGTLGIENDFKYFINSDGATVTAYVGTSSSITVPETLGGYTVKYIDGMFKSQKYGVKIKSISIPKSIEYIDSGMFCQLNSLASIKVDNNNAKYLVKDGILFTKDLKSLVGIPQKLKVYDYTVPNGVESIDNFINDYISTLNISSSVKSLPNYDDYDFTIGKNLKKINVSSENKKYSSQNGVLYNKAKTVLIIYPCNKRDKTYVMPSTVKEVSDISSSYLQKVTLSKSLLAEEYYFVLFSEKLNSISVQKGSKTYSAKDGVLYNKNKTVLLCYPIGKKAKKFAVPNSVKIIDESAAEDNIYLKELIIGRNVSKIRAYNFIYDKLKKVVINSPNVKIGDMCFYYSKGSMKIYGLYNSTAQKYANKHKIKFKAIKLKYPSVKVKSTKKKTAAISYKKVSGADKYKIYRKSANGKYKLIKTTNNLSYKDTKLKAKKTYYYKVKAVGKKLKSDASNAVMVKIK